MVLRLLLTCLLPAWVGIRPASAATAAAGSTATLSSTTSPSPSAAYWVAGADGSVFAFGSPALGSAAGLRLARPVVGITGTPSGHGYWLVAADGAVFAFGDAGFFGSTGGMRLNRPVVGMAATPDGLGYWLVAADGGVFTFGDARYYGSTGGVRLNRPIVGIAGLPTGNGYRLVADDGGLFAFGTAEFLGSTGAVRLNRPVVGMATTPSGPGYWLIANDGGVFAFGAPFYGSTGGLALSHPIVGMAASPVRGYSLVASDGGIFTFGDAHFAGSAAATRLRAPIVGMAVDVSPRPYVFGQRGYDISWPQCGRPYPARPFDVAIVGVNGGRALTTNPCLVDQATRWASPDQLDVYLNLNRPPAGYTGGCPTSNAVCIAYVFGLQAAQSSVATARSAGLAPRLWWLDIENPALWAADTRLNAVTIQAAVDTLRGAGLTVGLYGTRYQWGVITGGYTTTTPLPLWAAGVLPLQRCNEPFSGGYVVLSQVIGEATASGFDEDAAC